MRENARFIGLIVFFVVAAGALWFVVSEDPPDTDLEPTAPTARAPRQPAPEADYGSSTPRPAATPETPTEITSEVAPTSAFAPRQREERRPRGRGKITGTVTADTITMPTGVTLSLYKVGWKQHEGPSDDALQAEIPLKADGTFEFERLPYGTYAVHAHTTNATAEGPAVLSKTNPIVTLTMDIEPVGTISGTVRDKSGNPVEGATVHLGRYREGAIEEEGVSVSQATVLYSKVESAEDGSYALQNVVSPEDAPNMVYSVIAKSEGYAPSTSDLVLVGTTNVDLVLTRGGTVSGHVVFADSGAPAPGIKVAVDNDDRLGANVATSSDDGSFQIAGIAPGDYTLDVIDDELVATESPIDFVATDEAETSGIRIALAPGGSISGRVYDEDTNKGISGETVLAYSQTPGGSGRLEADTDASGRYKISGLRTGAYSVRRPAVYGYPRNTGRGEDRRMVSEKVAQDTEGIDFALSRGLYIEGVVVDQDDKPIADAQVTAQSRSGGSYQNASTRDDGAFVLAGLSPGSQYTVRARKDGLAAVPAGPMTITEEGIDDLRIVMGPPSSIAGTIVDLNGNPVPQARVYAFDQTTGQGTSSAEADQFGTFMIDNLSEGYYKFQLSGPGGNSYRPSLTDNPTITLAAQEQVTGVRLVFDQDSGLSIAGRITDTSGEPVQRVHIDANGSSYGSDQTDDDGRFEIVGLQEGTHRLVTRSGRYSNQTLDNIQAGDQNLNIILRGRGTVEGQIIDATTRQPIKSFSIYQRKGDQGFQPYMNQNFSAMYDEEGRFSLDRVEEGAAIIMAKAEGYAQGWAALSNVSADRPTTGVIVALERGAVLEGVVIDTAGQPISSAMIFAGEVPRQYQREQAVLAHTKRDGSFSLDCLSAGTATISAYHASYSPTSVTVNLSSGGGSQIEIVLSTGGIVEGTVTHGGQPLAGQSVHFQNMNGSGSNNQAQTDANGFFSIAGLPEGDAIIYTSMRLSDRQGRSRSVPVSVMDEAITTVNIDFPLATASVEGIVYADDETPVAEATVGASLVSAIDGATEGFNARTDADGYYLLEGLSEGSITLRVYAQGHSQKSVQVDLAEGESLRKDILLGGGGTIIVTLDNVPQNTQQSQAMALRGEHKILEFTMESMMELQQHMATAAQVQDGVATLAGLEPGTYTILAFAIPAMDAQTRADIEDIYASMSVTSTIVTIEEEN